MNFWILLRIQWKTFDFHSPEVEGLKIKVSDYKQAAQLAVGQLALKTGHGFPGTEEMSPVNTGKTQLGSQNQHIVGKSTSLLCWPLTSGGPTNQPPKIILEKQLFVSWFHLAYGLGNLELSPGNRLVFIKLANAFSLDIQRRECYAGICRDYYPSSTLLY